MKTRRRFVRPSTFLLAGALLITGAACGSDDSDDAAGGSTQTTVASSAGGASGSVDTIVIKDFKFLPDKPQAKVGDTVKVKNEDTALHSLTAKEDKSLFDTGQFKSDERTITLDKAGSFEFVCSVHPYMTGVIQVSG